MKDLLKKLVVKPGARIKLRDIDAGYHGRHESHQEALPDIQSQIQKIDRLQYLMYAEKKHSLLIVLQGLDAAGKDGIIRHVLPGWKSPGMPGYGVQEADIRGPRP